MEWSDWKDFLHQYKWMPYRHIRERFGIKRHDIENYLRNSTARQVFDPWRVSAKRTPEQLQEILKSAWEYYFTRVGLIDFSDSAELWVPKLISTKNVGQNGFSFLVGSKYLQIARPEAFADFRERGYTNVALAAYEFYPGRDILRGNAVLPYMFQQTHVKALESTDAQSMVEHVYLNFLSGVDAPTSAERIRSAKEKMYVRYRESAFVTGEHLSRFGVPGNFYSKKGTLRSILESLHRKYGEELGFLEGSDPNWSSAKFKALFPERHTDSCEYCGQSPVDLHHLLPRKDYPHFTYDSDNVVPICVNIHQRITRNMWSTEEVVAYNKALKGWLRARNQVNKRYLFKDTMELIHSRTYGNSFLG